MILIFNLHGGLTDMFKDLVSIIEFTNLHNISFTIRECTCRPIDNPLNFSYYDIKELFDETSFYSLSQYYLSYDSIKHQISNENTYDFYNDKIKHDLWYNHKREFLKNMYSHTIINCSKEFIIIGGAFWWYSNLENIDKRIEIIKKIKPSNKIYSEYLDNIVSLPESYNAIHYRYENDWIPNLKQLNIPYIVPPVDELIKYIPFNNNFPIYICCSMIDTLYDKHLLYNKLDNYTNIIKKKDNNLNFDENGFLDLLLVINCQEFYGNTISGFSESLHKLKNTNNCYDKIKNLQKYNIIV